MRHPRLLGPADRPPSRVTRDADRALRANVDVTRTLATLAAGMKARLVHVSTDLVLGGEAAPYREDAAADPTSGYGCTKLEAEPIALAVDDSVVVRVALLFGPTRTKRRGFFDMQTEALRDGAALRLFDDGLASEFQKTTGLQPR